MKLSKPSVRQHVLSASAKVRGQKQRCRGSCAAGCRQASRITVAQVISRSQLWRILFSPGPNLVGSVARNGTRGRRKYSEIDESATLATRCSTSVTALLCPGRVAEPGTGLQLSQNRASG